MYFPGNMFELPINNFTDWQFHMMVSPLMASQCMVPDQEAVLFESLMSHEHSQGVKLHLIQAPMCQNFSLWRPKKKN